MDKTKTIGAVEKRELARIIDSQFKSIIDNIKQEVKFTEGDILTEAHKKFGIDVLNKEIAHLREKIQMIENKKRQLGFNNSGFTKTYVGRGYNTQVVDPGTKAGRFYYIKVARNIDIQGLEDKRAEQLKKLWLENDREAVKEIINEKIEVATLPKPKRERIAVK